MDAPASRLDLQRFVDAQRAVWNEALGELRAGAKRGHWMWFIFPQIAGLGRSDMARLYAIRDLDEACAYLEHPILAPRLVEATRTISEGGRRRSARAILGEVDAMKLRSSLTLFDYADCHCGADPAATPFGEALCRLFSGQRDRLTLEIVAKAAAD